MTTSTPHLRPELEPLTPRLARLRVDARGYVVPWFVADVNGVPDFRVMDPAKWLRAVRDRLCWVCGEPLGRFLTFVVGPMCGLNRTTAEPPSHRDCAEWSARNCPFLTRPQMVRREGGLPDAAAAPAGFMLARNPGVALLWTTRRYQVFKAQTVSADAGAGYLIEMGDPTAVAWYVAGRPATRVEVAAAVASGLPALQQLADADRDPVAARRELARAERALVARYPAAS